MTEIFRKDYEGYTISLTDDAYRFQVSGGSFNGSWFKSYDEATQAIDAAIKTAANAKRSTTSIAVLLEDGTPGRVTGIHQRNGSLTGIGESDVYPPVDDLAVVLAEQRRLSKALSTLTRASQPYRMGRNRAFGRVVSPERCDELTAQFTKDLANADAEARKDKTLHDTAEAIRLARPRNGTVQVVP